MGAGKGPGGKIEAGFMSMGEVKVHCKERKEGICSRWLGEKGSDGNKSGG